MISSPEYPYRQEFNQFTARLDERNWRVPSFTVDRLKPKNNAYCLVIPVINEGERIREQLSNTQKLGLTDIIDTFVADGGSTDGSLDLPFLAENGVFNLLTKTGPGKLSAQLRCAYAVALLDGYKGIVTIDGNGKDSLEQIKDFVSALNEGVDYAQASRFISGGKSENTPLSRLIAIRLVHAPALSLAARRWFTDTTQGYRAYSARYLLDDRVQPFRDDFERYELLAYLTVRASQLGFKTTEIATKRVYPAHEKIPTKISGLGAHFDLVEVLFDTLRGKFNPPNVSG